MAKTNNKISSVPYYTVIFDIFRTGIGSGAFSLTERFNNSPFDNTEFISSYNSTGSYYVDTPVEQFKIFAHTAFIDATEVRVGVATGISSGETTITINNDVSGTPTDATMQGVLFITILP